MSVAGMGEVGSLWAGLSTPSPTVRSKRSGAVRWGEGVVGQREGGGRDEGQDVVMS